MGNAEIAKLFKNIAAAYSIKNEKKFHFQIIAYQKASEAITNTTSELKDLYLENRLDTIPGIGPTIKSRLEELFKKGHVKHFDFVFKGIPPSVFALIDIPTIGPKKAYKLANELSLKESENVVDKLIDKAKKGEIAKIPTFGEKSQQDILTALLEYKQGKNKTDRMLLPYAYELAEKLLSYIKQSKDVIEAETLGSLRRMKPTVHDIDIAVSSNNPEAVIKHFVSYPYKERVIEEGPLTASLLTTGGKQIDLMVQPQNSFGSLLQHFTGSKDHNVKLREHALKKGLSLSEKGIKQSSGIGKIKEYKTEEEFYAALGMKWIPPEIRENTGEIELAIRHELPKLVELSDVKGDLHIHSNFAIEPSHDLGHSPILEMTEKAINLNYEYIGFSEHNPSVSKHNSSQIYKLIARRNEEIEHIKLNIKDIHVIKMLEIDILTSGNLAVDDKSLNILDGAIVSVHSSFGMNKTQMTDRIIKGLSHPKAKILAHPTGRMLNERPGYDFDFEKIFEFCKKHNKALEINSWPTRLDLPDNIIRLAVDNGVKLVINTDSHDLWQMDLMRYGLAMARRGWAKPSDIVNALGYNEFIKWLKK